MYLSTSTRCEIIFGWKRQHFCGADVAVCHAFFLQCARRWSAVKREMGYTYTCATQEAQALRTCSNICMICRDMAHTDLPALACSSQVRLFPASVLDSIQTSDAILRI